MRPTHQIVFASGNLDKLREMRALFSKFRDVELHSPEGLIRNVEKIGFVEKGATYAENARAKARLVNQACHYPSLADDSGLEVMALDGAPGIYSARYAQGGQSPTAKLLEAMSGKKQREARFVCALVLVIEGVLVEALGTLEGTIAEAPRGKLGFGYDPIFIPKGEKRTLAEMTETEKNRISHRAVAVDALMKAVQERGIEFVRV